MRPFTLRQRRLILRPVSTAGSTLPTCIFEVILKSSPGPFGSALPPPLWLFVALRGTFDVRNPLPSSISEFPGCPQVRVREGLVFGYQISSVVPLVMRYLSSKPESPSANSRFPFAAQTFVLLLPGCFAASGVSFPTSQLRRLILRFRRTHRSLVSDSPASPAPRSIRL